ncbi:hypothetical protein BH23VER1_BH23VER1_00670 [soil metagenome]
MQRPHHHYAAAPIALLVGILLALPLAPSAPAQAPAAEVTEHEDIVRSPHPPHNLVDVTGFAPGETVVDPTTDMPFRVPGVAETEPEADPEADPAPPDPAPVPQPRAPSRPVPEEDTPERAPALRAPPGLDAIAAERIGSFIQSYILSGESDDPSASARFYTPSVREYFGKKNLSQSAIVADRKNFIDRWPERRYELVRPPVLLEAGDGRYTAMANFDYRVRNGARTASGSASSYLELVETQDGLRIDRVEERRARRPNR